MSAGNPTVQVELVAAVGQFKQQLADAAKSMQTMAKAMGGSLGDVDNAARKSGETQKTLLDKFKDFRSEQVQQGRQARFLAAEIASIVPAAGGAGSALQGLIGIFIEGAAGGIGFGLALEGAKLIAGTLAGVMQRAEEEAKKTAAALKLIQDRVDAIGRTPIQQKMHEVASLGGALKEAAAAEKDLREIQAALGGGRGEFGASLTAAEEERAAAAKARIKELADQYQVSVEDLPKVHAALLSELGALESRHRTDLEVAAAESEEKKGTERREAAKRTSQQIKQDAMEQERALAEFYLAEHVKAIEEVGRRLQEQRDLWDRVLADKSEREATGFEDASRMELPAGWKTTGELDQIANLAKLKKATDELTTSAQAMGEAFGQAFAGMLTGQMTVAQGMAAMMKTVINGVIDGAKQWIMAEAAASAASAAKSQAGIPVVGPFLAAGAMVAMLSMVQGLVGQVGSAARGWDLPAGGPFPAVLHSREMVLPERYADVVRRLAGGGGAAGGDTFHITNNLYGIDGPSIRRMVESDEYVAATRRNARLGRG